MRTSNVERPTSNIEVKTRRASFFTSTFDVGRSTFDVGRSTFDVRIYLILIFATLPGCCPQPKPATRAPYIGPTDTMDTVVQQINQNAQKIPTLWTQLNFTATLVDPGKRTTNTFAGDGALMYARPMSLFLKGDKDVAGEVFEIGSNDKEFWVKIRSTADSFDYWWGHYASLGKPGCRPIPIRPDLVLQVLGVGVFRTNFLVQPSPVMRFDNAADAYVFDFNEIVIDHWEAREEIWYDRLTKFPMRVILYGIDGRAALMAELSRQTPVETAGLPREQWPKIARHYDLFFPDTGTKITFDFMNDPQLQHQGRHLPVPNANSFNRPDPDDNNKVIQIDEGVE
jgi:hypothetical protein